MNCHPRCLLPGPRLVRILYVFFSLSVFLLCLTESAMAGLWTGNGPEGGLINTLAIDPATPTTVYAGTSLSGAFKSTDGGESWTPINNGLPNDPESPRYFADVFALAIDPMTSAVYAGTSRYGVFKSTDGGGNWSAISEDLPEYTDVHALAIDPVTPGTVYAGTSGGGVFKSENWGANWYAIDAGLPEDTYVKALAIDPVTPETVYAGTSGDGVFKRTNGGASWFAINAGLTNLEVSALAIDPVMPGTVYAGTWGDGVFVYVASDIDEDGDTDGSDLAMFAQGEGDLSLAGFAADFGRVVGH